MTGACQQRLGFVVAVGDGLAAFLPEVADDGVYHAGGEAAAGEEAAESTGKGLEVCTGESG